MKLTEIILKGYKSVEGEKGQTIPFGDVTVLLGANGSGKSNLVSFFRMLQAMMTGELQNYVARQGASRLLHYGPKRTQTIAFELTVATDAGRDTYQAVLSYGPPERLFIGVEQMVYKNSERHTEPLESRGGYGGLAESQLSTFTAPSAQDIGKFLAGIRVYQFHDTSDTARVKDRCYVDDAGFLRDDAGNLAAFLKMLKESADYRKYYERIVRHIRRVMPQFGDFELNPVPANKDYVRLNWRDSAGGDYRFDPGQLSDGTLRFMALATLLLQPPDLLPKLIVLDEPELGLHPAALSELAGLVRSVSHKAQILLATQSTRLVDEFEPEDIVVVERDEADRCSVFKKPDPERLRDWLAPAKVTDEPL